MYRLRLGRADRDLDTDQIRGPAAERSVRPCCTSVTSFGAPERRIASRSDSRQSGRAVVCLGNCSDDVLLVLAGFVDALPFIVQQVSAHADEGQSDQTEK